MIRISGIIVIFCLTLAHKSHALEVFSETETTEYGPVTMVLDSLAQIAVNVSDESSIQMQSKMNRTVQEIAGNMEVVISNAMAELSDAIYETNSLFIANPDCNPAWNLEELIANVTNQLSACTSTLANSMESFRYNAQEMVASIQTLVQQIGQLPHFCQLLGASTEAVAPLGFASGNNCFLRGMTEINQNMAQAMHNASLLLVRTRQQSQEQVAQSQQCSDLVVSQIRNFLSEERANCNSSM
ncbi:uncharacterized protein [Drosophila tropicalis]|uniref:uncharacterized protein n=1 Tax=Drosophila tropicalis TaxID=46794 RepID=UPI0035AC0B99